MTIGLEIRLQSEELEAGRWYTVREAAAALRLNHSNAYRRLGQMHASGLLERRENRGVLEYRRV